MIWVPPEDEVSNFLTGILEEMIACVKSTVRVIDRLDNYVKILNADLKCDLGKMITESVRY